MLLHARWQRTVWISRQVEVLQQRNGLACKKASPAGIGAAACPCLQRCCWRLLLLLLPDPAAGLLVVTTGAATGATTCAVHAEDAAVSTKFVIGAPIGDSAESHQTERSSAHDAGLAGDVEVATGGRGGVCAGRALWRLQKQRRQPSSL